MSNYLTMSKEQLEQELRVQTAHLEACRAQNLKLNMARGKPAKQQLDAVSDILSVITLVTSSNHGKNIADSIQLLLGRFATSHIQFEILSAASL